MGMLNVLKIKNCWKHTIKGGLKLAMEFRKDLLVD